jgi:hypothetical protein
VAVLGESAPERPDVGPAHPVAPPATVTSNRGPDEWIATFADPVRAEAAIDRFTSNAYDLVIGGESTRERLKPGRKDGQKGEKKAK